MDGPQLPRAVLYCRASDVELGRTPDTLDRQRRGLEHYAEHIGLAVVDVVVDENADAAQVFANRPGGRKALRMLESERAEVLVAFTLNRLFRGARDAVRTIARLAKAGATLQIVNFGSDGRLDTACETAAPALAALNEIALAERLTHSDSVRRAKQKMRKRGIPLGGFVPYGWQRGPDGRLVKAAQEQKIIAQMATCRSHGMTYRAIADKLNTLGTAPRHGGRWHGEVVRKILAREAPKAHAA
jgi:site-specific DNA recombinase